jgi:hypothetical protein
MDRRTALSGATFGKRIAEEEGDLLSDYFVKTEQWRRLLSGEVDIVYGPKGSGKSALYTLLTREFEKLRVERRTVAIPAENPRGTPAFRDLVDDPPSSEEEFRNLWKIYFLILLGDYIRHHLIASNTNDERVEGAISTLVASGLMRPERTANLKTVLKAALDYIRSRTFSLEGGIKVDPLTGTPEMSGKVTLGEPTLEQRAAGAVSTDDIFEAMTSFLAKQNITVWLLLDRLDVAFTENSKLEKNALRALFRAYLDLQAYSRIGIKVFLRDDIWRRIVADVFREASHITRSMTIVWDQASLLNLIVRRALYNGSVVQYYGVDESAILGDGNKQMEFFYQMFPDQVASGERQTKTLDWMLSRISDGYQRPAPRELIHLLNAARDKQLRAYELGSSEPLGTALIGRNALKESLSEVSRVRFEQTLCAEYPALRRQLLRLENKKTAYSIASLSRALEVSEEQGAILAEELVDAGFFLKKIEKGNDVYWVPFIYRDALRLVQGAAD